MVLDRSLGWWWADPAAAAAIAVFLVVAGVLTLRDRGSHART
jgi:divalent metal cation (Fe/Co/Zn/Cd) transporter